MDLLLKALRVRVGEVSRARILLEQSRRDLIYPHVGSLGREDRRDQKLQRIRPLKLCLGIGILSLETGDHLLRRGGVSSQAPGFGERLRIAERSSITVRDYSVGGVEGRQAIKLLFRDH